LSHDFRLLTHSRYNICQSFSYPLILIQLDVTWATEQTATSATKSVLFADPLSPENLSNIYCHNHSAEYPPPTLLFLFYCFLSWRFLGPSYIIFSGVSFIAFAITRALTLDCLSAIDLSNGHSWVNILKEM